jgi:hypothetical protein
LTHYIQAKALSLFTVIQLNNHSEINTDLEASPLKVLRMSRNLALNSFPRSPRLLVEVTFINITSMKPSYHGRCVFKYTINQWRAAGSAQNDQHTRSRKLDLLLEK